MIDRSALMSNKAILCVDDEVIILLSLVQELRETFGNRFLYEKATNATDALKKITELADEGVKVILIVSDWLMPGIKGDDFLDQVRLTFPEIKAVMITGQADQEAIRKVQTNRSVLAVFKKPWDSAELVSAIADACGVYLNEDKQNEQ